MIIIIIVVLGSTLPNQPTMVKVSCFHIRDLGLNPTYQKKKEKTNSSLDLMSCMQVGNWGHYRNHCHHSICYDS